MPKVKPFKKRIIMKCEDFKKHIADLCDKSVDATIKADCMRHIEECASCRAYYNEFMHTVDLLTPRHTPTANARNNAVVSHNPRRDKTNRMFSRKLLQAAAVLAIFLAGVGTGLSGFFSTKAEATPAIPLIFDQSINYSRQAGSFTMTLAVRTEPEENFAYIDPNAEFIQVKVRSIRIGTKSLWRIEKEKGRTIVADHHRQYMWNTDGTGVYGNIDANLAEGFDALLHPENLLEQQKSALSKDGNTLAEQTETDSTITIVTHTKVYGSIVSPTLLENEEQSYHCTTENVFSKTDGRLKSISIWWEKDGQEILVMKSEHIEYNVPLVPADLIQHPDTTQVTWIPVQTPRLNPSERLDNLQRETAPQATRRILDALIEGNPQKAGEALFSYTALLPRLTDRMKGCHVSDISEPQKKKNYVGVIVFYRLTHPDGTSETCHLALRRDNPQKIWMVDGGL